MLKIKKGDTVQVTKGKDNGKRGKVLAIFAEESRALVEGVNMLKKHKRKTQADQQGGIVSIEAPLAISNLMLICKQCNAPKRAGFVVGGKKQKDRICKTCKEVI